MSTTLPDLEQTTPTIPLSAAQTAPAKHKPSQEDDREGWILFDGNEPVGAGPEQHSAIADARRRTRTCENHRQVLRKASAAEWRRTAAALGPGGLSAAEAAWCGATMRVEPVYRRSVDYAEPMLAIAARLGGRRDGRRIVFDDGSELELAPVRPEVSRRPYVRLPGPEEIAARAAGGTAAG